MSHTIALSIKSRRKFHISVLPKIILGLKLQSKKLKLQVLFFAPYTLSSISIILSYIIVIT